MHNLLVAVFFIAIVLSPCVAALWTAEPRAVSTKAVKAVKKSAVTTRVRDAAAKPVVAAAVVVAEPVVAATVAAAGPAVTVAQAAAEAVEPYPTREGLLKCARSSQLRRFHIHQAGSAGEIKLRSLRPAA